MLATPAAVASGNTVDVGAAAGPITLNNPVRTVPVTITRTSGTPMLGFSVGIAISTTLNVSGGLAGIEEGTYLSSANPSTSFNIIDEGVDVGGNHNYKLDGTTLGLPCGSGAASGTLFTIDLAGAVAGGSGTVTITSLTLRDCSNTDLLPVIGTASTLTIDRSAPSTLVISPNGGEVWPVGALRTISWSGSDPEGVASYDVAYSQNGGATYPHPIATVPGTQTSYAWTVPATPTSMARVRVTARDTNGNTGSDAGDANFSIGCPTITVTAATTHLTCNGGTNGAIDIAVSGGAPPYSYQWGDGPTSEDRSSLAAGSYSVTVTDANGCPRSLDVMVSAPPALVASETHSDACLSAADGTIDVTVSGGVPPYSYLWADGPVSEDRSGLAAGGFSLTVTDASQCTTVLDVTIGLRSYTVAASTGPNGSILPVGSVPVSCGADQSFTIAADPGYQVLDLVVDAVSQGPQTAWTFTNVQGNHTITASFLPADNIAAVPGGGATISPATPCLTVPVVFTRADATPVLGYSVTIELSPTLFLCGVEFESAGYPGPPRNFLVTPQPGNRWTIDEVTLGSPCGVTGSATLFHVSVSSESTSGTGSISVVSTTVRDCSNSPVPAAPGLPGEIGLAGGVVSVGEPPLRTRFVAPRPAPFRASTTLEFELAKAGRVDLAVFSVSGRHVRTLASGAREIGLHRFTWDGSDEKGNQARAGVYFARLTTEDGKFTHTLVRVE